jgi:hypothetical protein
VPDPRPTVRIPASSDAVLRRQLERVVVERETQGILDYLDRRDGESPDWRNKAGIVTAVAVLSADDAAELRDRWQALLEPYVARTEAGGAPLQPGQRYVRYFVAATPLPDLDSEDSDDESDD